MPKFEKQFVHFMWSDELKGKSVFYADDICNLINYVKDDSDMATVEESDSGDVPFAVKGAYWKFVYYDPYYALKRAHEQGEVIQHFDTCNKVWIDATHKLDWTDNIEHYRVKPEEDEPEEKLITNRELAQWLAEGYGQCRYIDYAIVRTYHCYAASEDDMPVRKDTRVRLWGDPEWHIPTRRYMYY